MEIWRYGDMEIWRFDVMEIEDEWTRMDENGQEWTRIIILME